MVSTSAQTSQEVIDEFNRVELHTIKALVGTDVLERMESTGVPRGPGQRMGRGCAAA